MISPPKTNFWMFLTWKECAYFESTVQHKCACNANSVSKVWKCPQVPDMSLLEPVFLKSCILLYLVHVKIGNKPLLDFSVTYSYNCLQQESVNNKE